jgi:hypothetical protein
MIPLLLLGAGAVAAAVVADELFPIKKQCAWCKKFLPSTDKAKTPGLVSHGMCPKCVEKMKAEL